MIFTLVNELLRSTHKYSSGGGVDAIYANGDATTDNNIKNMISLFGKLHFSFTMEQVMALLTLVIE